MSSSPRLSGWTLALLALWAVLFASRPAGAVPGPDSTAIIANLADPESVALAEAYRRARAIPPPSLCLLDLPTTADLSLDDYRTRLLAPFEACLEAAGATERIEAVALVRGVPLRVLVPIEGGVASVALAAALGTWKSTLSDGTPLLGQPPGNLFACGGGQCYGGHWRNTFRLGVFEPGWSRTDRFGVTHRPLLVTMLHGRSYEDAARLFASAMDAEAERARTSTSTTVAGRALLMNGADPARGVLDSSYPTVLAALAERGVIAERVAFDPDLRGARISALFTGTAAIGDTIEGSDYLPGSIVDNLTSFGAVPDNFDPGASEVQVSIARWGARGVAGVHGTVDEPLNDCFPARDLVVDWIDGATLAETFLRAMPYVYWRNLVLGDPLAAAWADRPVVTIDGVAGGALVRGAVHLTISARDPKGRPLSSLQLYANGAPLFASTGGELDACVALPVEGEVELLAVAQVADDGSRGGAHRPKGWTLVRVMATSGPEDCAPPDAGISPDAEAGDSAVTSLDGGARDGGGLDADLPELTAQPEAGCTCLASRYLPHPDGRILLLVAAIVPILLRRARSRHRAAL